MAISGSHFHCQNTHDTNTFFLFVKSDQDIIILFVDVNPSQKNTFVCPGVPAEGAWTGLTCVLYDSVSFQGYSTVVYDKGVLPSPFTYL